MSDGVLGLSPARIKGELLAFEGLIRLPPTSTLIGKGSVAAVFENNTVSRTLVELEIEEVAGKNDFPRYELFEIGKPGDEPVVTLEYDEARNGWALTASFPATAVPWNDPLADTPSRFMLKLGSRRHAGSVAFDADDDGATNDGDNCPALANPKQEDDDEDGAGNLCDNCPDTYNPSQGDADHDGVGDACQPQCGEAVPGDGNGDDIADGADYTIWADNFGAEDPTLDETRGDFNCDGRTDGADYTIWADNFEDKSLAAAEPPPPACGLGFELALALAAVGAQRSKKARTASMTRPWSASVKSL